MKEILAFLLATFALNAFSNSEGPVAKVETGSL